MKTSIQFITTITIISFLGACGGGGGSSDDGDVKTGQFKDSAVKGLTYETATQSGITDEKGTFKYKAGEKVTFKIGAMEIGSAKGEDILYPTHITSDKEKAVKVAQILQTLDKDSNPKEGIDIEGQFDIDATRSHNIQDINLQALVDDIKKTHNPLTLVDADQAEKHMDAIISADTRATLESVSNQDDINSRISIDNGRLKLSPQTSETVWLLAKSATEITSLSADIQSSNVQLLLELKNENVVEYFRIGIMDAYANCMPDYQHFCPAVASLSVTVVNSAYYGFNTYKGRSYFHSSNSKFDYTKVELDKNTILQPLLCVYGQPCTRDDVHLTIELDRTNKKVVVKFNGDTGYYDISSLGDLSTTQAKFFISDYAKTSSKFINNVKINNQDFDDFSATTLDTTKWKTGKFSSSGH